jgi:hypothetical protein
MSLDIRLEVTEPHTVYSGNITHNLTTMAQAVGLYQALWYPFPQWQTAKDILPVLREGLARLKADPARYQQFNPANGWGSYEGLVGFVERYIRACEEHPDAEIRVSR